MNDLLAYTGNPLVLLALGLLTPPMVSFFKAWPGNPKVAAAIFWAVCAVFVILSMVLDDAFNDVPDGRSESDLVKYFITKLLVIAIVASMWYRNAWRPSGADEKIAKNSPPQLGPMP